MEWIRRIQPSSGVATFSRVSSTDYVTTGSPEEGYQSILTTNETDTVNTLSYRCRARNTIGKIDWVTNDSVVEFVGMYQWKLCL